jgi:hypothetical protein
LVYRLLRHDYAVISGFNAFKAGFCSEKLFFHNNAYPRQRTISVPQTQRIFSCIYQQMAARITFNEIPEQQT